MLASFITRVTAVIRDVDRFVVKIVANIKIKNGTCKRNEDSKLCSPIWKL